MLLHSLLLSALFSGGLEKPQSILLIHTNDVHGQVLPRKATWISKDQPPLIGGLPRLAAHVRAERRKAAEQGRSMLVLDGGDCYQGTPEGGIDNGLPFVIAQALVGYDAMAIGNHDYDHGIDNTRRLLTRGNAPFLCANIRRRTDGAKVDWATPYRVFELAGLRVAVVGFVTVDTPNISHPETRTLEFRDPARELAELKPELRQQKIDWILPLTHLGIERDRELARAHPDLALIVGGHSHTYLATGAREGETLIVQTGSKAGAAGHVELEVDRDARTVRAVSAKLVDLLEEPAGADRVPAVDMICAALVRESDAIMSSVVGEALSPIERTKDNTRSGSAGNWITDLMRSYSGADVALMNRGGIRTDLRAGPLTRRDCYEICPFDNNLVVLSMPGAELEILLGRCVESKNHSGVELSGARVMLRRGGDGVLLTGVQVGGAPLDPKRIYRVAVNSFMANGGDAYFEAGKSFPREEDPILMRDLLSEMLRREPKTKASTENRYELVTP
jgi:2',3'-cyclic-nucleotide 2'-phosphodiesterase (5'-nucleotidase family)